MVAVMELPEDAGMPGGKEFALVEGPAAGIVGTAAAAETEPGDVLEVTGGAASGGIIVRAGRTKASAADPRRLACGAHVRVVEREGERVMYELVSGEGPASGWVSLSVGGKSLLVLVSKAPPDPAKAAKEALRWYGRRVEESRKLWEASHNENRGFARCSFPWSVDAKVLPSDPERRGRELRAALAVATASTDAVGDAVPRSRANKDAAEDEDGELVSLCKHCNLPLGAHAYAAKGEKKAGLMHGECMAQVVLRQMREEEDVRRRREAEVKRARRDEYDIGWRAEAIPDSAAAACRLGCPPESLGGMCCLAIQEDGSVRVTATVEPAAALNLEYLSLALKVRRLEGREPLFSLDPVDPSKAGKGNDPEASMQTKRFEPEWLAGTSVGEVMFQADYHLKELSMGEHEQPVVGMKSCFDYSNDELGREKAWSAREWFIVRQAEIRMSQDNVIVPFLRMGVEAREQFINPEGQLEDVPLTRPDHPLVKYAEAFTSNFDLIAERKSVVSQLREVAKATVMAKFMLECGLFLDDAWFSLVEGLERACCLEVPQLWNDKQCSKITVQNGELVSTHDERSRVHSVYGGVDFGVDRFRLQAPGRLATTIVSGGRPLGARPASTLMAGQQTGLSLAPTRQFARLTAPFLAGQARLAAPSVPAAAIGARPGLAAPLSAIAATRPASALLASSRVSMAMPGRMALTSSLGARAGLAPVSAIRPALAAPLSALSMAGAARPLMLATTRLGMAGPQGVDLSLEKFNLSSHAGDWAGCLEAPPEVAKLAVGGEAFWSDLDGPSSVFSDEDRALFAAVFAAGLSDRRAEGERFAPPPTGDAHLERLRALVKAEGEVRQQRKAHFFSGQFTTDNVGPLFPSSWTSTIEIDSQQTPQAPRLLESRPDLLAERELLDEALRSSAPAFQKRTEDGVEFSVYRLGALELRATRDPGAAAPVVGAAFVARPPAAVAAATALRNGPAASGPSDDERVAKVTEYVERSPFGRLRCQYYVTLQTVVGRTVISEKLPDGTVTWQPAPRGAEDRTAFARVLRTVDCFARGLTVGAVRQHLAQQAGAGAAASKHFAHGAYRYLSGETEEIGTGNARAASNKA